VDAAQSDRLALAPLKDGMTATLAVCGASGFLGRHFLNAVAREGAAQVRLLVHHRDASAGVAASNLTPLPGDLLQPGSLPALVHGASAVVNLAYLSHGSRDANLTAAANLARACRIGNVRRLVHMSTATVVGRAPDDVVTESTAADPRTDYERTKLEIERILIGEAAGTFELVILRPTAVFGPWGQNLVKLASSLSSGNTIENYLRSCLHGRRRMNLLCVENAIAAILFATQVGIASPTQIFIVSDDDDITNNYRDVESTLRQALERGEYALAPAAVPDAVLRILLRCSGRSNINPDRVYSSASIAAAGFRKAVSFNTGLAVFVDWFRQTKLSAAHGNG